jgi:hypothetical protein
VETLQPVTKHGAVLLAQDAGTHLDHEVRTDTDEEAIESRVVEGAERDPVLHDRIASGLPVRDDVRGLEQLAMPEAAECALIAIRFENALAEGALVEPLPDDGRDVGAARLRVFRGVPDAPERILRRFLRVLDVIDLDPKGQRARIVPDDEHGPGGHIPPEHDPVEVDQRGSSPHGFAEAGVVSVRGIRAAVLVVEKPLVPEAVVIRPRRGGCDRERHRGKDTRLEDPLRAEKRDALSPELESPGEEVARQHVSELADLAPQPVECSDAYLGIYGGDGN